MKKILGLGVVALLVMALVGGGTWAYFNDVETSGDNILSAGTLNLGLDNTIGSTNNGSATGTWTLSNLAPGDNATAAALYAHNSGTINMTSVNITFAHTITNGTPTTVYNYAGTNATDNLSNMIWANTVTWNGTGSSVNVTALIGKTLGELSTLNIDLGYLNAGVEAALTIGWSLNATATNGCQGDSANITVTLTGNQ